MTINSTASNNLKSDSQIHINFHQFFDNPNINPIKKWEGGKKGNTKIFQFPYPIYNEKVSEFFNEFNSLNWAVHNYDPDKISTIIYNDKFLSNSSIEEIKSMLTFCARGERFCTGFWQGLIKDKTIVKILIRLRELTQ